MSTLISYKGLSVLNAASGAGGNAINTDFTTLADRIGPCNYTATTDPTSSDNQSSTPPYYVGSRWMNQAAGTEWVCIASSTSAATWETTTVAASPWIVSGTNISFSEGSVAIGTTSANFPLEVDGAGFNVSGTAYGVGLFIEGESNYNGPCLGYDSTGQISVILAGS